MPPVSMADLFWPGDHRAGPVMSDATFLAAMVDVENAWLRGLVDAGVAPPSAAAELGGVVTAADVTTIADGAETGGNPVIELVGQRNEIPQAANRVVGLTSCGSAHQPDAADCQEGQRARLRN